MSSHFSRSTSRRRTTVAGFLVAAGLVAASCSSDGDSSTATETVATDAPATTEATASTSPTSDGTMWTGTEPNTTPVDDATAAEWQALFEAALAKSDGLPGAWIAVSNPERGYWSGALGGRGRRHAAGDGRGPRPDRFDDQDLHGHGGVGTDRPG